MPASLNPATWTCGQRNAPLAHCQAHLPLAQPGADARRTRDLTLWSIVAGLLLACSGTR